MKNTIISILGFIVLLSASVYGKQDSRLLRFPDTNNKLIVFSYAGDIWSTGINGGDAKHLTSHKGQELFPKLSPDGKWIAFSAEYSGSRQVYVMPATGGTPKQLTYFDDVVLVFPRGGYNNIVLDWTHDSKKILFRSNRTPHGKRVGKYFLIDRNGGYPEELPIPEGGFGALSPDGTKLCYTPISREFRNWKRYKGGRAADVWIYDLKNNKSERITTFKGTDQTPVWYKDSIYFMSDRDLKLNVHKYNTTTKKIEQVTKHTVFDGLWLSGRNGSLVYEHGGHIYKLNPESGKTEKLTINIDFDNSHRMPYLKNVRKNISAFDISPNGNVALFCARGDIFTVPAEEGVIENLTSSPSREVSPAWSPNGKYIAYYSDKTGEYEIYLREYKTGKVTQLTKNSSHWINHPVWSPDSTKIVYADMSHHLRVLDITTGKIKNIDKGTINRFNTYSFSKDSNWITYTKLSDNGNSAIWVYSLSTGKKSKVTSDIFSDYSPVFSDCGHYIFFQSQRDFNLKSSAFESKYLYRDANKIFAVYLTKDSPDIFKKEINKVEISELSAKKKKSKKASSVKTASALKIDLDGIFERVVAISPTTGTFYNMVPVKDGFLFTNYEGINKFSLKKQKASVLIKKASGFTISPNEKKLIYSFNRGRKFGITTLTKGKAGDGELDLSGMEMRIDPVKEWNQIYRDAFRIFRDWFYVRNIHNVDWKEVEKRYSALLPHIGHRSDLDYILGEVIGETNAGHTYVNWGDFETVKRVHTAYLGAVLTPDTKAGKYRFSKIYKGENWNKLLRSPLKEQGVNVKTGDYLIAIDGVKLTTSINPYMLLEGKADRRVKLTVSAYANGKITRDYYVKPVRSEQGLRYHDWVLSRRALVDKLSGGKIGYIHVPNTAYEGHRELFKGMYAYHKKPALIIDDRYNGGGFIPDDLTRLLERKTRTYWRRQGINGMKTPSVAHDGHKAMLINHYASSGGDCFPYYFRMQNLGTIIGTRTWGGLIGISYNAPFVDGGSLNVPSFGIYDRDGKWTVEGIGIYPDIEVYDTPHLIAEGKDPSIEKAVEVLLKKLKEEPVKKVTPPAAPDRSKWIEVEIK